MSEATAERYDAIVVGSGQGGGPLSTALAKTGMRTAIIERVHVGGTCINEGCTPTKTMVASARAAYLARRASDYGVHVGDITVEMAEVRARKQQVVDDFRAGSQRRIERTDGVDLLMGTARFSGDHELEVELLGGSSRRLSADRIFINVGARPVDPPIPGLSDLHPLNSTTIMELVEVPEHLLVLGGGYVGLEFGQMFRRFGSEVIIVQRGSQLLGREDGDVADEVKKLLEEDGIEILLETEAVRAARGPGGEAQLTVRGPGGERVLSGSHVLAAAGRAPNTDDLNLSATGLETDRHGFLPANERLETKVPGIYALGDVKGGPAFTHISYDDFRIIRTNLIEGGQATIADRPVPYTVFIDPQLGRVGMSESEARAAGRNVKVAKMPMSYVARAIEVGETRGVMKVVVDADTEQILGCAILGIEGGELMSMLQIAMMGNVKYSALREAIFAHPTLAESFNNLFGSFES